MTTEPERATQDIFPDDLRERVRTKAPVWVRELVFHLAGRADSYAREADMLRDAIEAATATEGTSDTMLTGEGDVPDRPLPDGATVEFNGKFAVTADTSRLGPQDQLERRPGITVSVISGNSGVEIITLTEEDLVIRARP